MGRKIESWLPGMHPGKEEKQNQPKGGNLDMGLSVGSTDKDISKKSASLITATERMLTKGKSRGAENKSAPGIEPFDLESLDVPFLEHEEFNFNQIRGLYQEFLRGETMPSGEGLISIRKDGKGNPEFGFWSKDFNYFDELRFYPFTGQELTIINSIVYDDEVIGYKNGKLIYRPDDESQPKWR